VLGNPEPAGAAVQRLRLTVALAPPTASDHLSGRHWRSRPGSSCPPSNGVSADSNHLSAAVPRVRLSGAPPEFRPTGSLPPGCAADVGAFPHVRRCLCSEAQTFGARAAAASEHNQDTCQEMTHTRRASCRTPAPCRHVLRSRPRCLDAFPVGYRHGRRSGARGAGSVRLRACMAPSLLACLSIAAF